MVRTADTAVRVGGKSSKKSGNPSSGNSSSSQSPSNSGERGFSSYNSVCHRETPQWQRPITSFFTQADKNTNNQAKQSKDEIMENEQPQVSTNEETMDHATSDEDSNKENDAPVVVATTSKAAMESDLEMSELNENAKKKINLRDDYDDDTVPKKKRKLDPNMYQNFEMLEQSEVMMS